jgi:hypothetical protein
MKSSLRAPHNDVHDILSYSTAVGTPKNLSLQKNNKAHIVNGISDSLLNRTATERPRQCSQQTHRRDESAGNIPQTELHNRLGAAGKTSKFGLSVCPKSNVAVPLKPPPVGSNVDSIRVQNYRNSEASKTTLTVEKCLDKLHSVHEETPPQAECPATKDAFDFNLGSQLCEKEEEPGHRETAEKAPLAADVGHVESSGNSCTEKEQEDELKTVREENKEIKIDSNSTRSFETVNTKAVEPSVLPAAEQRVNFRCSSSKAITAALTSDVPPSSRNCSPITRSTPTPPLKRALSAPPQQPGKSILVQRNKRSPSQSRMSVDMSSDGSDREDGEEHVVGKVRGTRRRVRTAGPRRKARGRDEDSSGDEAEAGARQKQKNSAGRRGLPPGADVVTMVSLLSDGSDAEADPPGPFLQPAPWLEERNNLTGQNQREQASISCVTPAASGVICLRKMPKTGKCPTL